MRLLLLIAIFMSVSPYPSNRDRSRLMLPIHFSEEYPREEPNSLMLPIGLHESHLSPDLKIELDDVKIQDAIEEFEMNSNSGIENDEIDNHEIEIMNGKISNDIQFIISLAKMDGIQNQSNNTSLIFG